MKLNIGLLRRNRNIHQRQAERKGRPRREVGINEARPLRCECLGHASVSIAGKINEEKLWMRTAGAAQFKEVDGLGASGRIAGLGDLVAYQGINQARFADVGASEKCDFGGAGGRELRWSGGTGDEPCLNLHAFTMAGRTGKGK